MSSRSIATLHKQCVSEWAAMKSRRNFEPRGGGRGYHIPSIRSATGRAALGTILDMVSDLNPWASTEEEKRIRV